VHIVVANEPRAYREVIAAALRALRPELSVATTEPCGLDAAIVSLRPHFVLCSRLTEVVETRAPGWVVLYPDGAARVVIGLTGRRSMAADIELSDLLAIVDQAACLVETT
jgi:hypothetical protein